MECGDHLRGVSPAHEPAGLRLRAGHGSDLANLKELRLGSRRTIFAFDRQRTAVLLVAGDKRGQWSCWYTEAIPEAETRFTAWMEREERP